MESEMEHPCDLAERFGKLLFDSETADLILIVEGQRLPAHRLMLTISNEYFRALLNGGMMESLQKEVVLADVTLRAFKPLMAYIYTGQLRIKELDEDTILELLEIVHLYGFDKVQHLLCQLLQKNISMSNVCKVYNKANYLQIEELIDACRHLLIAESRAVLESDVLCDLSEDALVHTLTQDTFDGEEIKIFNLVQKWCRKRQPEKDFSNVLRTIRLPLISTKDLVTIVKDSGLVSTDSLIDAIRLKECCPEDLNGRVKPEPWVNFAPEARKLKEDRAGDVVVPSQNLAYKTMPPSRAIQCNRELMIVALRKAYAVNHIAFRLSESDRDCRYCIDVSLNLKDWVQVIDHMNYKCSSYQNLYFATRVVRYIRVEGKVGFSQGKGLISWSDLEVKYIPKPLKLICGFPVPTRNVAHKGQGASLTGSPINSLIGGGPLPVFAGQKVWTVHEIGKGSLMIKLAQPYVVDSMRMLLNSTESRSYSYYIETSLDEKNWTRVADRTTELHRSSQDIKFKALPVLFIKIVGTKCDVDQMFMCTSFECPASKV